MTVLISPAPNGWQNLEFGATSPFPYSASRPHKGRDWGYYYADTWGSQRVVAPVSGVVESVYSLGGFNSGWGNRVVIRVNSRVSVALNHFATGTISVRTGQDINAGDYIGQMGATGETYGQVHLHEELWIDGVRVDPQYYRTHDIPGTPAAAVAAVPITADPTTEENDMAGLIQHKDRGIALIAPGYFKAVTPEELQIAVARYGWPKVYDDSQVGAREFDLDVSLAVNGAGGDQQVRSELERSRDAVLKAINGMRGSV